jgi:hypothetical protein
MVGAQNGHPRPALQKDFLDLNPPPEIQPKKEQLGIAAIQASLNTSRCAHTNELCT